MSLPHRQQVILEQIERALQAADPRLKSMFTAFGRWADTQPSPASEVIRLRSAWRTVLICVLVIIALGVLVVGIRATSGDCPGLSSDQVVASAAVRHAGCTDSTNAWSRGAR